MKSPLFQITRPEELPDKPYESFVGDTFLQDVDQNIMIDIVEETFYISFDEPLLTRKSLLYGIQCGVAAAMRTEAVRSIFKVTFVNSFQYHSYYLLHQFVVERGYAERSCLSVFLRDVHSSRWLGRVAFVFQRKDQFLNAGKAHTVDGFPVCTLCHITRLGIYSLISQVIHFLIEKNTIKPLKPVFRGLTMLCQTV